MNSKEELLQMVLGLSEALSSEERLAKYYEVETENAVSTLLESILDIEFSVDMDMKLLGAELTTTCGGPTIWIETRYSKVVGVWGSDRVERSYNDGIGLDDLVEDCLFSSAKR